MENVRKGKGIDKLNKLGQKTTDYEGELKAGHIPQCLSTRAIRSATSSRGPTPWPTS